MKFPCHRYFNCFAISLIRDASATCLLGQKASSFILILTALCILYTHVRRVYNNFAPAEKSQRMVRGLTSVTRLKTHVIRFRVGSGGGVSVLLPRWIR